MNDEIATLLVKGILYETLNFDVHTQPPNTQYKTLYPCSAIHFMVFLIEDSPMPFPFPLSA